MFTQNGERLVSEAVCDVKRLLRIPARRTTSTSFIPVINILQTCSNFMEVCFTPL